MRRFVILDAETTGVSYKRGDRMIQLAFVVMEGTEITGRFMSYLDPGQPIPPFIQSLTQINDEMVKDAPLFSEVAPELLKHLDGAFFVAHNVNFDLTFVNDELEAAGYSPFEGPVLDTVELARIAFPTADGFKLTQLSDEFDITHGQPHRADSDAEATAKLLQDVFAVFETLPLITLQQIRRFSDRFRSSLRPLLDTWIEEKMKSVHLQEPHIDIYRGIALAAEEAGADEKEGDFTGFHELKDAITGAGGRMTEAIDAYESRPGQAQMMEKVYEAMETRQHALIEAGTGTGKSLAYLIPAACYAREHNEPVVISTYTIQLQEQLLKKDVPLLKQIVPFPVKTALIKGREHYISLRKLEAVLEHDPTDNYDRALAKAQILVWLTRTKTGDIEELNLSAAAGQFWNEISAGAEDEGSQPWYPRCFYQRARKRAQHADLIITNHALILSDHQSRGGFLPAYKRCIVDEAHHFEEAASFHLGLQLDYVAFSRIFNEAGMTDGSGILSNISRTVGKDGRMAAVIADTEMKIKTAKAEVSDLFLYLHHWAFSRRKKRNDRGRVSVTYFPSDPELVQAGEAAHRALHASGEALDSLLRLAEEFEHYKRVHDLSESGTKIHQSLMQSLAALAARLQESAENLEQLLLVQEDNTVYWLEADSKGPKQTVTLRSRPVDVSGILADDLFGKKDSMVLTSATLTVNRKFDYIIRNLGLGDFPLVQLAIESPFSWKDQVKLMVPTDLPLLNKVDERLYCENIVLHLYRLSKISEGRMLVLFTSYEMLRTCHELLKDILDEDYMLISQGINGGSRTKLTKSFQQFDKAVMLGTSSFWEGVDIPGEDLTLLVMARLPFTPPDDPVYKAKSEALEMEGRSSFMELAIPQAIIRFKQGFGRLIRKQTDRGAVIVLDRRIETTRYGRLFVKSLPDIKKTSGSIDELEEELKKWL
ncbi:ATP-dependent DNA helicase DinG [Alteribacter natronophilus]|uniref:ATP-dependent DNA helicase DinG n=1 Tax=Alteribacter natronophilus TaxID=2583810 RepID=UPI00110D99EC|nr:ATP-dependent DNA helicase DinG [Alteribacter natronophilus]TMW73565.1 ATP-dependent DNA helicase DinG [Alteribacter natronophilus]